MVDISNNYEFKNLEELIDVGLFSQVLFKQAASSWFHNMQSPNKHLCFASILRCLNSTFLSHTLNKCNFFLQNQYLERHTNNGISTTTKCYLKLNTIDFYFSQWTLQSFNCKHTNLVVSVCLLWTLSKETCFVWVCAPMSRSRSKEPKSP